MKDNHKVPENFDAEHGKEIVKTLWTPIGWAIRLCLLVFGMLVMTMGISLVTTADIGTTPISTVPYTLSEITDFTFGQMTFAINVGFVAFQLLLLRSKFRAVNFLQIPVVWVFSMMLDWWMGTFQRVDVSELWFAWLLSLSGNLFMAIGIYMQVRSKTLVQPGEGIVLAVALVTKKAFSTLKIINDVTLVVLAVLIALVFVGHPIGVGWGTLVSAVLVGLLIKAIDKIFRLVLRLGPVS